MIYGTAAVGIVVLKNVEQAATAREGRGKVLPGTGSSSNSVMAGDHKNLEIPMGQSLSLIHI